MKTCSECKNWTRILGYSLGRCRLLGDKDKNEAGEIIRDVCTSGLEKYPCFKPRPIFQEIYRAQNFLLDRSRTSV